MANASRTHLFSDCPSVSLEFLEAENHDQWLAFPHLGTVNC